MSRNEPRSNPPAIPSRTAIGWGSITLWIIGGLLCSLAGLLLISTLLVLPLGGPREPPSQMTWEEFKQWTDSGAWFWDSMKDCALWGGVGILLIALPFPRLMMKRKQSGEPAA